MRYLSVCSGIEAATVAWHNLGWTPVGFSEIEPFPSAVLAHHYPNVPNFGDMTQHEQWPIEPGSIDLLVGGTPCQSFSVAGLRKGLHDPRGGLMLTYLEIARRLRPRWIVWENVPGVLSSNGGRDFGSFLGAMGLLGYGVAYRVLDAQWCRTHGHPRAVPQRRRRVFVVGCLGDWERAAQVLFECESLQRDSAPRRTSGQVVAVDAEGSIGAGRWWDGTDCAGTLTKKNAGVGQRMPDKDNLGAVLQSVGYRWQNDRDGLVQDGTAPACRASSGSSGFHEMNHPVVVGSGLGIPSPPAVAFTRCDNGGDASVEVTPTMRCGSNYSAHPAVAFASNLGTRGGDVYDHGVSPTVRTGSSGTSGHPPAVAHALRGEGFDASEDGTGRGTPLVPQAMTVMSFHPLQDPIPNTDGSTHCMGTGGSQGHASIAVAQAMTVRRLLPVECERLQGFPDDYTLIPWRKKAASDCPDGPRYKALGNSMAVNCMAWIGERIAAVDAQINERNET